jgi:hypothetical protein
VSSAVAAVSKVVDNSNAGPEAPVTTGTPPTGDFIFLSLTKSFTCKSPFGKSIFKFVFAAVVVIGFKGKKSSVGNYVLAGLACGNP